MVDVAIEIAGTDITEHVLFSTARFSSQVNSAPGEFYARLRDPVRSLSFVTGSDVLLKIDGEAVWRGFLNVAQRVYVFPAINVDAFGETRFMDLSGPDINVLFNKRIVFNQTDPEVVEGKLYPPFTADDTIIADLVADYLDLSSDAIDTSTFVDNVGDSTNDQEGRAWSAGDTWGQAMGSIAMLPAAIYYLRPTLAGSDLVYCDVDTPNAPYAMSDVPGVGGGGGGSQTCEDFDDWARTEGGTWGTSSDGHEWFEVGGGSADLSVNGSAGVAANGILDQQVLGSEGDEKWATSYEMSTVVRFDTAIGVGEYVDFTFRVYDAITDIGHELYIFFANPADEPSLLDVTDSATTEVEIGLAPPDTDINIKWEFTPEGLHRAKVWWSGGEPDWMVSRTDGNAPQTNDQNFRVRSTSATEALTVTLGTVPFCTVPEPPVSTVAQYREMEITQDGTSLVNDQLAWGMGFGSPDPVFVRDQDAASQALHGLWQAGTVRYGIYKQGTINRVAASIVDGSPQSKRGAKNDKVSVLLTTYQPGFLPSQKIDFTSEVWGFNDVIPIRKMEVTFEAPDNPKFRLTLSHEIDAPWGFIDQYLLDFTFPPFPPLPPFPPFQISDNCECGVTDTMQRTVAPTDHTGSGSVGPGTFAGISDSTLPWNVTLTNNTSVEVVPGFIQFTQNDSGAAASMFLPSNNQMLYSPGLTSKNTKTFTFSISELPGESAILYIGAILAGPDASASIWINSGTSFPTGFYTQSNLGFGTPGVLTDKTLVPNAFWASGVPYLVKMWDDGTQTHIWIRGPGGDTYQAATESPEVTSTYVLHPTISVQREIQTGGDNPEIVTSFSLVNLPEFNRCTMFRLTNFLGNPVATTWGGLVDRDFWYEGGPTPVGGWENVNVSNMLVHTPFLGQGSFDATGDDATAACLLVDESAPWAEHSFTASFAVRPIASGGNPTTRFRLAVFEDTFTAFRTFDFKTYIPSISVTTDAETDETPYTFEDGVIYLVKCQVELGVACRIRIWRIDEAEPLTWNLEVPDDGATDATPSFRVEGYADFALDSIDFFWIDIEYEDEACYSNNCNSTTWDTFSNRSTVGADPLAWGESSRDNVEWTIRGSGGSTISPTAAGDAFVAADLGVLDWEYDDSATAFVNATLAEGPAIGTTDWFMVARFRFLTQPDPGGSGTPLQEILLAGISPAHPPEFPAQGGYNVTLAACISDDSGLEPNVWYRFKFDYSHTLRLYRHRVWLDGTLEPTEWDVSTDFPALPYDMTTLSLRLGLAGVSPDQSQPDHARVEFDWIDFNGNGPCPVSIPVNPNGGGCEEPVRVDDTTFQCSASMVAGSSRVYVNGLLQRPGIAREYTESTAASGTIVFADPVASTAKVVVCYQSAGPLGGT